jgi:small nuclear ribonucleoprotein D2
MTEQDLAEQEAQREAYEFEHGQCSLLNQAVKEKTQLVVLLWSSRKLLARIKAFDRHGNMVLSDVKEIWYEVPKKKGKKRRQVERSRLMRLLFLKGDNVISVVKTFDTEAAVGDTSQKSP